MTVFDSSPEIPDPAPVGPIRYNGAAEADHASSGADAATRTGGKPASDRWMSPLRAAPAPHGMVRWLTVLAFAPALAGSHAAASGLPPTRHSQAVPGPTVEARLPTPATWPARGPVVRAFQPPPQPWLPGHRGVDLAVQPGASVVAAAAGRVVFAGRLADRGVISIEHSGGFRTTYEPVVASVRRGQQVRIGERVGVVGDNHPGCVASACLHWGAIHHGDYLDPLLLVGAVRVRLLPVIAAPPLR
ncbi:M23 family metallopeptidase [Pilimelia columellifera]|uniref:M23ase beta-sheet core domain-containing protein n=1 Tax=Pilimelia columellifera subsp. columellifera TaxID=706583 RepID=A0ABP6AEF8_9ACTN